MKQLIKKFFRRSLRISLLSTIVVTVVFSFSLSVMGVEKIVPEKSEKQVTLALGSDKYKTSKKEVTAVVTNESVNTVKTSIFGANDSWVDDGYGLWDAEKKEPYSAMLPKVKASGVYHIRYPGGTEGDYIHWYDMVGDVSKRTPQIDAFSKEFPIYSAENGDLFTVTFGVDELYEVCKAAGIKATIQLNAGNGSPQEAADYIQYIKNKGWLKYTDSFAIGNEVCLPLENLTNFKIQKSPLEYINFCEKLFDILGNGIVKNKDIKLGIIGMPASHPLNGNKNWDKQVIDALKGNIDFIDVHIGYAYYYNNNGETPEQCMKCFMAAGTWVKSLLEEEKATIAKYGGEYADDISIQICEWGPVGGSYPNSLGASLFVSDVFNVILEEPKVSAADYLPLLNHYAAGNLIGANTHSPVTGGDEYYWNNCASYVFKWYSDLVGNDVLETQVTGAGRFNSDPVGMLPAIENVDDGDVNVYYDESTGKGTIFVLNRSLDENLSYTINLPTEKAVVTDVTELWNADPTASNSWQNPNNIAPKSYQSDKKQFGTLNLISKPASLVKIEFSANDIEIYIPKSSAKTHDKKTSEDKPLISDDGNEVINDAIDKGKELDNNDLPVLKSKGKKIIKNIIDNLPVLILLVVIMATMVFIIAETFFVMYYVLQRRKNHSS
mgnify:CR=1 FL=1